MILNSWCYLVLAVRRGKRFLITVSISLLVIGLFRFAISSWFSLGRLYVSSNLSTFSRFNFWHTIYKVSFFFFLNFKCITYIISFNLPNIFWSRNYYNPHFTDEETDTEVSGTCPNHKVSTPWSLGLWLAL